MNGRARAHLWRALATLAFVAQAVACAASSSSPAMSQDGGGHAGISGVDASPTGFAGTQGAGGTGVQPTGFAGAGAAGVTGAAGAGSAGTTGAAGAITGAAGTGAAGTGFAGTGAQQDAGAVDGPYDSGGVPCEVVLGIVFPVSASDLESGPTSVLRVHAVANGYRGTPLWNWEVFNSGGASLQKVTAKAVDDAGSTVEIKLENPGNYRITANVLGAPQCEGPALVKYVGPPRTPSFRFRVTPPAGARLPVRETLQNADELAAGPQTIKLGEANQTSVVSLAPLDGRGIPLSSYVRLTGPSFSFELEANTARGPIVATLASDLTYDVLIVPDRPVAPLLVTGTPDVIMQKMTLTTGVTVTGEARDGADRPVVGAHVILRSGARPSTVGTTDADGKFSVLTREGPVSVEIAPPPGSGLPGASLSAAAGLVIFPSKPPKLTMRWPASSSAPLTVTVRGVAGTPLAGARVRAQSRVDLTGGALSVHAGGAADVDLPTVGAVSIEDVTDDRGTAALGLLPVGSYALIVAPPDGSGAAISTTTVELTAGGLSRDVTLPSRVNVVGTLIPRGPTAGARVTAIDLGDLAPPSPAIAMADADGKYALSLSPGRTYELLVEPEPGRGLARSVIRLLTPGVATTDGPDRVPSALVWSGRVEGLGRRVAGAVVQVFCVAPSASCLDPSLALAQGVTGADGTLDLTLPSPTP